ncbi:MAG: TetR/AcrR family transcriptional regulator [Spirochaetes bacterium]|nr:TetR/AcrR family transcriptional regulator [Spirochaetota bacterium]
MEKSYHKKTFENIPEEKRERIFQAAITEFASNGFNGANINTIADNAGISIGSLYKYFSSKDDLFLSIINRGYKLLDGVISEADLSGGDMFDKIEKLLRAAQKYAMLYPEINQIYLDLATEGLSHLSKRLSKTVETISVKFYRTIIAGAKKEGVVPRDLDDRIASFCLDNILMMVQYSYTSKYFMERMRIFLGDRYIRDPELIVRGVMQFIRGGFSRGIGARR